MIRERRLVLFFSVICLGVFGYNYWYYYCGRCTLASFATISSAAMILLAINILAAGTLIYLRQRRKRWQARQNCSCGATLIHSWSFCPACGSGIPQT